MSDESTKNQTSSSNNEQQSQSNSQQSSTSTQREFIHVDTAENSRLNKGEERNDFEVKQDSNIEK